MNRRTAPTNKAKGFFPLSFLALSSALFLWVAIGDFSWANTSGSQCLVYVGTYTGSQSESKGIYAFRMDTATGSLTPLGLAAETISPGFLAVHPNGRFLYAVNEVSEIDGKKGGAVRGFTLDSSTGKLTLMNWQPSKGINPCHLSTDKTGKTILVANYGGTAAAFPIQPDGHLNEASSVVEHKGSSTDPARQEGPHPHGIYLDPANQFAVVPDLGQDKVLVYRFDSARGTLVANNSPSASLKPGAGPRHFAFHPKARYAYVINELNSTITAFSYDSSKGILTEIQTLSTLPAEFKGKNTTAEIAVHPSGKFLYGSNRGHDSIAVFQIDPKKGTLTTAQVQSTLGKTPRNFGIDPTGKFLLAANQDSNTLVVFKIDPKTGQLSPTGAPVNVPKPACVVFVSVK
jgi:6-phosphogluconolactonase